MEEEEEQRDELSQRTFESVDAARENLRLSASSNYSFSIPMDWLFQFETSDFYYFKSNITYQLDLMYGDISGQIVDIEQEILRSIEQAVRFT